MEEKMTEEEVMDAIQELANDILDKIRDQVHKAGIPFIYSSLAINEVSFDEDEGTVVVDWDYPGVDEPDDDVLE